MSIYMLFTILIVPLVATGIIHHFIIIRYNLASFLVVPVDQKWLFLKKPLFGKNKTWRGFVVMSILNGVITYLVSQVFDVRVYSNLPIFVIGTFIGAGYSIAELPTSFIKRRLGIAPSNQAKGVLGFLLYLLDQSDSVFGSLIMANMLIRNITMSQNIIIAILGIGIHILLDWILYFKGYKARLEKPVIIKKLTFRARLK